MSRMVSRYLVRMVVTCRPRTLSTRDINIEVSPELYWNHHATEKRPYQYNKLLQEKSLSLFLRTFILSLPKHISVYDKVPWSYPSRLFLKIWYHLTVLSTCTVLLPSSPRLAPYCSSLAGTLLLITGWHPTACHRLAPYCHSSAGTLLLLIGLHPTASHRPAPYCSSSLAGIPSALWLRSPSTLPIGLPLLSYA